MTRRVTDQAALMGATGSLALFLVYILVLTIFESFGYAMQQLTQWIYWIVPLTVGFGIQVGLYSHIRAAFRARVDTAATGSVAASGGISTTSMIACCLHHLTDVLPILGLSAATVVLIQYQSIFMALGLLSNIVGITFMLMVMQQHGVPVENEFAKKIFRYDMTRVRNTAIAASVIILIGLTLSSIPPFAPTSDGGATQTSGLQPVTNEAGGVSFEITPQGFSPTEQIVFNISITTHQGSLDYDFAKISTLETSSGSKYTPLKWDGASGGHHLSGALIFPPVGETNTLKLTIRNVYDVPERVFQWNLGSQTGGAAATTSAPLTLNVYILGITIVAVLIAAVLINRRPKKTDGKYEQILKQECHKDPADSGISS